ncbi:MAG: CBS domain containing-hemolysin-like protein [Planctomycetota bacterium]|jgi:CBS domain containing-hemolysin-like protein
MTQIIIVASLTLLASFFCSLFEAVLYAIPPARVDVLRREGGKTGEELAKLKADVEEPIAAILTINTIAHTVGAAWCGAMVGDLFGSAAVGIFAAIFTVLVLAFTEIVPKSFGVQHANKLALFVVRPIKIMIWSVWPIVWVAKRAMHAVAGESGPYSPSEDDVMAASMLSAKGGKVRGEEAQWVRNALMLDRVTAADLRTPRTVVHSYPADTPLRELIAEAPNWIHSRVPITEAGGLDEVAGKVYRREVYDRLLLEPETTLTLRDLAHPIEFVPDTLPAHELLQLFLSKRMHLVALKDEYGGFDGVVTLEDVLESLLGQEIVDEHDEVADMQALARERHGVVTSEDGPVTSPERESDEAKPLA